MKRLLTIAAMIAVVNVCYSQGDFRQGYVVTHAKDTIHGLVAFREGSKAFSSCIFKKSKEQEATTYGPPDIAGYGFINDRVFETRDITLRDQPPATAFLEVLVKGRVTLYRVEDVFLVQKEGGELQQLINEKQEQAKEIGANENQKYVRYTNEHIAVLNQLLFDCLETREAVSRARLVQRSLTSLIERYNECMGAPTVTFKEEKRWFHARPAVVAGYTFSKIDFDYSLEYEHLSGSFETSKSPVMGISSEFLSPRVTERFSFYVAVLYSSPKYVGYTEIPYLSGVKRHYVTIDLPQFKFPIGIRYTLPERTITPYINAGFSTTVHVNENSHWIKETDINGTGRNRGRRSVTH